MKGMVILLAAMPLIISLCGCSTESRKITVHKPGVYKGDKDQLLALKNQQELVNRFMLIQTDR